MAIRSVTLLATILLALGAPPAVADWETGKAAFNRGEYTVALQEFSKYVQSEPRDPRYANAYYMVGSCHKHLGHLDEAEDNLRLAVELAPDFAEYRLGLGQCLAAADEYAEADSVLGELDLASLPAEQRTGAALLIAGTANEADNPSRAVAILEEALTGNPSSHNLHRALGSALEGAGDCQGAFAHLARAFELDSEDQGSGREAVRCAADVADGAADETYRGAWLEKGIGLALSLARTAPDHRNATLAGDMTSRAGRLEEAAEWYGKAHEAKPDDPRIAYDYGRALDQLGQDAASLAVLTDALTHDPDPELARHAHLRIAKLHARGLDLDAAAEHFRLAGDTDTANRLEELADSFRDALEARRDLLAKLENLRGMKHQLEQLNDAEGVRAVDSRADAIEVELTALDANLEQVQEALGRL